MLSFGDPDPDLVVGLWLLCRDLSKVTQALKERGLGNGKMRAIEFPDAHHMDARKGFCHERCKKAESTMIWIDVIYSSTNSFLWMNLINYNWGCFLFMFIFTAKYICFNIFLEYYILYLGGDICIFEDENSQLLSQWALDFPAV